MSKFTRRTILKSGGAAAGTLLLPRFAIAQADNRPSVTIAVQKITNANMLDVLREQSNVGERVFFSSIWEGLIVQELARQSGGRAGPCHRMAPHRRPDRRSEAAPGRQVPQWRRADRRRRRLHLQPRAHVRRDRGQEPLDASRLSRRSRRRRPARNCRRMCPRSHAASGRTSSASRSSTNTPCASTTRRPTSPSRAGCRATAPTSSTAAPGTKRRAISTGRASRSTTGPYKVVEFKPDVSLTLEAHDEYWGGRPPLKRIRFVEVPEVASRINGLLSGEYQFACDIPPDQIAGIEKNAAFEVQGGTILNHRLTVFDKNHAAARQSAGAPRLHPRDRPPGHRRQPVGRPHPRAAGPAMGVLRRHVHRRLDACRTMTPSSRRIC